MPQQALVGLLVLTITISCVAQSNSFAPEYTQLRSEISQTLQIQHVAQEFVCKPRLSMDTCLAFVNTTDEEERIANELVAMRQVQEIILSNLFQTYNTLVDLTNQAEKNVAMIEKNWNELDREVKYTACIYRWIRFIGFNLSHLWCSLKTK